MIQKNLDIRAAIKSSGLRQWMVAKHLGIHEGNFSRLLREELPPRDKARIFQIINNLKTEESAELDIAQ